MSGVRVVCEWRAQDVKNGGKSSKTIHKAGESIAFSMDDSKELTAWVNDLTNVWKAYQANR